MPTKSKSRYAVTVWYYDKEERAAAIGRADDDRGSAAAEKATVEERRLAQVWVRALCADGAGAETLETLAAKAEKLPPASQSIVAAVVDVADGMLPVALRRMGDDELRVLRARFGKMGQA